MLLYNGMSPIGGFLSIGRDELSDVYTNFFPWQQFQTKGWEVLIVNMKQWNQSNSFPSGP